MYVCMYVCIYINIYIYIVIYIYIYILHVRAYFKNTHTHMHLFMCLFAWHMLRFLHYGLSKLLPQSYCPTLAALPQPFGCKASVS